LDFSCDHAIAQVADKTGRTRDLLAREQLWPITARGAVY
jgi:hypothetical protein